jgi:radical SAM superfamily enzyme YgiQ (UPF0313 family)
MSILPLSLLHLSRKLIDNYMSVEIIDQRYEKNFQNVLEKSFGDDLLCVGISCITGPNIKNIINIIEQIRKKTTVPIVLGGPHPTLLPEQTLESGMVDYVVIGPGETPFLRLVRALQNKDNLEDIPGIGLMKDGLPKVNPSNLEPPEGGRIPYHLVSKYGRQDIIPIITSYGCPYDCGFCVEKVLHPRYSSLPPQEVVAMIEDALRLKPGLVNFIDDNFLASKERVKQIFELCDDKGLHFDWLCLGRINTVNSFDDDTLLFLKRHGLRGILFGVESGSPKILELINKKLSPDEVISLNSRMNRMGIVPSYTFIIGFPTETLEDAEMTFNLIRKIRKENPYAVIWKLNRYTPYPKTKLLDLALREGFKMPTNFKEWGEVHFYSKEWPIPYDMYV